MEAAFLIGAPPRAKVRSCWARSRARREAFFASSNRDAISSLGGRSTEASEMLPMMAVRRLLKSCAMPPASKPSCSSDSAFRRSASLHRRSEQARTPAYRVTRNLEAKMLYIGLAWAAGAPLLRLRLGGKIHNGIEHR